MPKNIDDLTIAELQAELERFGLESQITEENRHNYVTKLKELRECELQVQMRHVEQRNFDVQRAATQTLVGDDFSRPDFVLGQVAEPIALRRNVCYIVAALVFRMDNEQLQCLLVQEAKVECKHKWYLPAGRMEPGESMEESTKRETKEEAGLDVDVERLLQVQVQGSGWYRFSFLCNVTGGELKTTEQADAESLQAKYFPVKSILSRPPGVDLRAKDIQTLVSHGAAVYNRLRQNDDIPPTIIRPELSPGMFCRLLVVRELEQKYLVLLRRSHSDDLDQLTIPIAQFSFGGCVFAAVVSKFYRVLFRNMGISLDVPNVLVHIQCQPSRDPHVSHDGLCVTLLVAIKSASAPEIVQPDRFLWHELSEQDVAFIKQSFNHGPKFSML